MTALFLHLSLEHLLSNVLMIFIWVSFLELYLTPLRSTFIFVLTGIAGSLMSVAIAKGNEKTLGASSGIFGLFGAGLAYLLFNWRRMDHENSPRGPLLCILILIILLTFVFAGGSGDIYAHLGGFISGMCAGLFLSPVYRNPATANQVSIGEFSLRKEEKIMVGVGVGCYTLMVGLMLLLM